MKRDYLMTALLSKPAFLSQRFNPDEYEIDLSAARAQSTVEAFHATARLVFGSFWDDDDDDDDYDDQKLFAQSGSIAMIPITGVLLNRFSYSFSMATGYNAVQSQLQAAMADPTVKGIIFDVNSPGGMVQGCMELADEIYSMRGEKPMLAVVDANCTSAAYALASSADRVVATRSADVGSIGVVAMHADLSGALDQAGVKVSFIYAGKHKVDGNPYEPLPADVKADVQASVDSSYSDFVSLVARNRNINTEAVRKTEAQIYSAADAVDLGLIDAVSTPQDAITAFRSELTGSFSNLGVFAMTDKTQAGAAAAAPDTKALEAAAAANATTAERTRINAILTCDEAKDRTELASHLALNTDLSAEAAKGILKAAPIKVVEKAAAAEKAQDSAFGKAMDKSQNPNVSAGGESASKEPDLVAQILGNYAVASGNKFKAA